MTSYAFHPEALADLTEIWEFIAEDNPAAADRVIEEIDRAIQHLLPFPHQGHWRKDLTAAPLKFWVVHDFLIVYAPDERPLLVVAILHGRRNPRVLAALLRGRE